MLCFKHELLETRLRVMLDDKVYAIIEIFAFNPQEM